MTTKKQWNLQALELDFINRILPSCNNDFEVMMVTTIHTKEVLKLANDLFESKRLTSCGRAIAEKYGFTKN